MHLSSFLTPFCPINPFFFSHPISFFSCFGSIANPLTPTDRSRKSSRRPGDADANAEFGDGDGCYGVEVRGMKGGQVVVVGWGLERKGGRGSEGERLDTKLPKSKTTNPNPIHPPPHFYYTLHTQSSSPQTNPLISTTHTVRTIQSAFCKSKGYTNPQTVYTKPSPPLLHPPSHPYSHIHPLHTPSNHPSQTPLFNESKLTETAPSKTIQYTLSLSTIFFTHTIKIS